MFEKRYNISVQQVFNFIFDCKRWEFCVLTFFIKLKLLANQLCHLFSGFYTYFFRNGQYLISPQKAAKNDLLTMMQMIC